MKYLFFLLLLLPYSADAQSKKVPAEDEWTVNVWENPQTESVLPWGVSYMELVLWGEWLDTESVRSVGCVAGNIVKEENRYGKYSFSYKHGNTDKEARTKPVNIYKTDYEYDQRRNLTHKKVYAEVPANSLIGVQRIQQLPAYAEAGNSDAFIDSVIASRPGPFLTLFNEVFCTYDSNNNPIASKDTVIHSEGHYSYIYNPNGQVAMQRKVDLFHNATGNFFYNTQLRNFTYDSAGRILSILGYDLNNDTTSDAMTKGVLHRRTYFHYNKAGLPDTITYVPDVRYKHIITYDTAGNVRSYTIIKYEQQWQDTVYYYNYKYKGKELIEATYYKHSLKETPTRLLYNYNKQRQLIEIRTYKPGTKNTSRPDVQLLYFYGNKTEDAATAKHSLYVPLNKRKQQNQATKTNATAKLQEQIFTYVEQMPSFNGVLESYIAKHLKYPERAKATGVQGRVVLHFIVDTDGSIKDVRVLKSLDRDCDKAAIDMLMHMPKWKPGKQNGKSIPVYYTMPVIFNIR